MAHAPRVVALLAVMVPLLVVLGAGVGYRAAFGAQAATEVRRALGSVVLYVFLPSLTFRVLYLAPAGRDLWTVPVTALASGLACYAVAWGLIAKGVGRALPGPTVGALLLAAVFCNATYLGLPVVHAVVGEDLTRVPVLFDLLANTPLLFTLGAVAGVRHGTRGGSGTLTEGVRQAARLPPLLAAVAGIALGALTRATGLAVPTFLLTAFELMGRTVSPLMIFAVGLALGRPRASALPRIAPAVLIRLVVGPASAWLVGRALLHDPRVFRATMLEAAMPTMMLTMVFAERYGLDEETLAQAILASTLGSLATLPLVVALT